MYWIKTFKYLVDIMTNLFHFFGLIKQTHKCIDAEFLLDGIAATSGGRQDLCTPLTDSGGDAPRF